MVVIIVITAAATGTEFVTVRQVSADRRLAHAESVPFVLVAARIMT